MNVTDSKKMADFIIKAVEENVLTMISSHPSDKAPGLVEVDASRERARERKLGMKVSQSRP